MRVPWDIRGSDQPADTPAHLSLMKRVAATMFVVGGLTSTTGVLITQSTPFAKAAQGFGAGVLVAIGLVLMTLPARRRTIEAAMLISIVIPCIDAAATSPSALSLVMIDLDHFKQFNDRHGHLEGDAALQRLSAILREESRPGDLVCRFGGEEFAVALPGAGTAAARAYAGRVAARLAAEVVDESRRLSVSCGVCSLALATSPSADALTARADEALYAAKSAGRRRAAWWTAAGLTIERDQQSELQAA